MEMYMKDQDYNNTGIADSNRLPPCSLSFFLFV